VKHLWPEAQGFRHGSGQIEADRSPALENGLDDKLAVKGKDSIAGVKEAEPGPGLYVSVCVRESLSLGDMSEAGLD
jgi:hypothetical protein